jgi:hypothetical protein
VPFTTDSAPPYEWAQRLHGIPPSRNSSMLRWLGDRLTPFSLLVLLARLRKKVDKA